jgi:DNA repair exonuclease SbcCD ATPase subunit
MLADQRSQQLSDLVRKKAFIEVENEQLEETSRIKESQLPVLESELCKVEGINKRLRSDHTSIKERKERLVQELESLASEAAFHETNYISNEVQKQKFEDELARLQNFIRDTTFQADAQIKEISQKSKQTEAIRASLNRIFKEKEERLALATRQSTEIGLDVSAKESQIEVLDSKLLEAEERLQKQQKRLQEVTRTMELLQEKYEVQQREIIESEAREVSSKLKADYIDCRFSLKQTRCERPMTQTQLRYRFSRSIWSQS